MTDRLAHLVWIVWGVLLLAWIAMAVRPETVGIMRAAQVAIAVALLVWPAMRWWRSWWTRTAAGVVVAFILACAVWPDRGGPRATTYAERLRSSEGTTYVWGGENTFGIDCSGLLRRAWITACLHDAAMRLRPDLVRRAADLWWHDLSARALLTGGLGRTAPTDLRGTIATLNPHLLQTGDLAVTTDGIHCLAYLDGNRWIHADPGRQVTEIAHDDPSTGWVDSQVRIVRWIGIGR